jgi:hypothetical protein
MRASDFLQGALEQVTLGRYDIQECDVAGPDFVDLFCSDDPYGSVITFFTVQTVYVRSEGVFSIDTDPEITAIVGPLGEFCEVIDETGFDRVFRDVLCKRNHRCLCCQYGNKHQ